MSIAFGGIIAFIFRGLNLAVALATVLLASHQLSKDDYGLLALSIAVIGFGNAMTGGLTAAVAYQIANQRRSAGEALMSATAFGATFGALVVLAGVVATEALSGDVSRVALYVGLGVAAVIVNGVLAGVFLGRNALVRYNVTLVLPPALSLALVAGVFLVLDRRTPEAALAAYAGGQWLAAATMALACVRTLESRLHLDRLLAGRILRFTLFAGMSSGVSFLNYRADLFMVNHFEGSGGAGTYAIAVYLAESVWQISGSLTLATYARIGSLDRREAANLTTRVMRHTVLILAVVCLALFAAAGAIESLFFGEKYAGIATALRYLLPGVLMYGLAQSYSAFYTYQRGLPWVAALVAGTGLVLDLALDVVLIPAMGVSGAALASSIAYGTAILGALAFFLRSERLGATQVFRFGRADLDDYRSLLARLRAAVGRQAENRPVPR